MFSSFLNRSHIGLFMKLSHTQFAKSKRLSKMSDSTEKIIQIYFIDTIYEFREIERFPGFQIRLVIFFAGFKRVCQYNKKSLKILNNMSSQCLSVLKYSKFSQKHNDLINRQLKSNELTSFEKNHFFQSPKSGKSLTLTDSGSSTKITDEMIDEMKNVIFCKLDNSEYAVQTITFTSKPELKEAIQNCRKRYQNLVMPINELCVESSHQGFEKLKIITKRFMQSSNPRNIEELCQFVVKLIESRLVISHNDIIQYGDDEIHINPIALMREPQRIQIPYNQLLRGLYDEENISSELSILLNLVKDYEEQNLQALLSHQLPNQTLFILQQTLINLLLSKED